MTINIGNLNINYIHEGRGQNIILLHGWGCDVSSYDKLIENLKHTYSVYAIDLPHFGKSDKLITSFDTPKYSSIILEFIKELKIQNPILIGHSYGGKIIIDLVANQKYNPKKIILIDASGIKKKKNIYKKYKTYKYKLYKKIIKKIHNKEKANYLIDDLRKKYGSIDYNNADNILKESLIKIVNEDYKNILYKIKCPTLLIWGEYDNETPLKDGRIMNKEIKNSKLKIIKNAKHFPLITHYQECEIIIKNFINKKDIL